MNKFSDYLKYLSIINEESIAELKSRTKFGFDTSPDFVDALAKLDSFSQESKASEYVKWLVVQAKKFYDEFMKLVNSKNFDPETKTKKELSKEEIRALISNFNKSNNIQSQKVFIIVNKGGKFGVELGEDAYKVDEMFKVFNTLKTKKSAGVNFDTDINKYTIKTLKVFYDTNKDKVGELSKSKTEIKSDDKESSLIYEDSNWEVRVPNTYEASCRLGAGAEWCTATGKTRQYYDSYTKKGQLYIIQSKKNKKDKWQFHFEGNEFMDVDDNAVNPVMLAIDQEWPQAMLDKFNELPEAKKHSFQSFEKINSMPPKQKIDTVMKMIGVEKYSIGPNNEVTINQNLTL